MSLLVRRIPRGVIYHKVIESIQYLLHALFIPLDRAEKIIEFESTFARYCEREHCVAFPFARTAIYFVLKSLELPKGSEILMPPITIKGIVDVVIELGLVPVYVETDAETINFQLMDLQRKSGPNTKAAIITPLFGLVPNVPAMVSMFRERGIFIIEDFSQCLNGCYDGKRIGTFGDVGIYSSSSIKTLDTLGGGMAVSDDETIHDALRKAQESLRPPNRKFLVKKAWINLVRNVATSSPYFSLLTFPLLQVLRKMAPEAALRQTGHRDRSRLAKLPELWFCRYTSVQAGIGLAQLPTVLRNDKARMANVEFLKANCRIARFPATTSKSKNVYWQLILPVPNAIQAQAFFASRGIDSATSSLELVCALREYPNRANLPMAESIYRNGIFIPCFPGLSRKDMQRIAAATSDYFEELGNGR